MAVMAFNVIGVFIFAFQLMIAKEVMTCDVLPVAMFLLPTLSSIFLSQVSKKMTNEHIDAIFAKFDDNGGGAFSQKLDQYLSTLRDGSGKLPGR